MTIDFNKLLLEVFGNAETENFVPEIIPVSMIDVDRSPPMSMELPMSDACPVCGGHNMLVGDYVCWGYCSKCYEDEIYHEPEA